MYDSKYSLDRVGLVSRVHMVHDLRRKELHSVGLGPINDLFSYFLVIIGESIHNRIIENSANKQPSKDYLLLGYIPSTKIYWELNNTSHVKGKGSIAKQNCVGSFQGPEGKIYRKEKSSLCCLPCQLDL